MAEVAQVPSGVNPTNMMGMGGNGGMVPGMPSQPSPEELQKMAQAAGVPAGAGGPSGVPNMPPGINPGAVMQGATGAPGMPTPGAGVGMPGVPQMPAGMPGMTQMAPVQPGMQMPVQPGMQMPVQPGMQMPGMPGQPMQMMAQAPMPVMAAPGGQPMQMAAPQQIVQAVAPQPNMAAAAPTVAHTHPTPGDHRIENSDDCCASCWDHTPPPPQKPAPPAAPAQPPAPAMPPATRVVDPSTINSMDTPAAPTQPMVSPAIPSGVPDARSQQIEQKVEEQPAEPKVEQQQIEQKVEEAPAEEPKIEEPTAAEEVKAEEQVVEEQVVVEEPPKEEAPPVKPPAAAPEPSWRKNIHDEEFKREAPQPALWKRGCDPDHESFNFTQQFGAEAGEIVKRMLRRHRMVDPYKHPKEPFGAQGQVWEETWVVEKESRDPYGESMITELADVLRKDNAQRAEKGEPPLLFIDPHFPPEERSLFADPATSGANASAEQTFRKDQDPFLAGVTGIEWKRPKELCNPNDEPVIFSGDISPDDVAQGRLGNCYFLAAIASCGIGETDVLIKDLIVEEAADVGLYGVKFYLHGKWITVLVDDLIPCTKMGSQWWPIFASPKDHAGQEAGKKEIWSMIFEKAWAKLHLSYEATAGGQTGDTTNYLSGGTIREIDLQPTPEEAEDQWQELAEGCTEGSFCFLSCALRPGAGEEGAKMGLIDGHAYSILAMKLLSNGGRLVQVRNPWGTTEWKGRYSDGSPEWTPELKTEVGAVDQDDGSFWMPWDDFLMYFGSVDVCDPTTLRKLSEDHKCRIDVYAGHWCRGTNAGGDADTTSFKCNPTIEMTTKSDGIVEFSMYQPDTRPLLQLTDENVGGNPTMMKLYLVDPDTQEVTEILTSQRRVVCSKISVLGNKKYHVIPTAWAPGVEGAFWVTASGCGCELTALDGQTPTDEQKEMMSAEHPRDLCCVACHGELTMFYGSSLGPMCPDCHENQKPRCFNCKQVVSGSYFPDIKGMGPCCLNCKDIVDPPLACCKCQARIEGSYYPMDEGPVCEACINK